MRGDKLSWKSILHKLHTQPSVTVPEAGYALGRLGRNASYQAAANGVLGVTVLDVGGLKRVPSIFVLRALGLIAAENNKDDKPMTQRIRLNEKQFKALVAGQIVQVDNVELSLADIGWDRMIIAITAAMSVQSKT